MTSVPESGVGDIMLCTQYVSPMVARYWNTRLWFEGTVRAMALSQSLPTPKIQELLRVVVRLAVGAPEATLPLAVAPMAPEPPAPEVSTPVKVTTVIDAATLVDSVAATEALLNTVGAKARQISAVPACVLVRRTSAHVSPPPVTPETAVLVPELGPSAAMNASRSSFPAEVVKVGLAMLAALVLRALDAVLSTASSGFGLTVSIAVGLALP